VARNNKIRQNKNFISVDSARVPQKEREDEKELSLDVACATPPFCLNKKVFMDRDSYRFCVLA